LREKLQRAVTTSLRRTSINTPSTTSGLPTPTATAISR
jgi:hypothetical protein